jgi:dynein light chain LC8-type
MDVKEPKSASPAPREKLEAQVKSADMHEDMQQEAIEVGMWG